METEHSIFKDGVDRFIKEQHSFDTWPDQVARSLSADREAWRRMAQLGWMALNVAEEDGGVDADFRHTELLMEALGRGLVLAPYVTTAVIAVWALRNSGGSRTKELLSAIAAGDVLIAPAFQSEPEPHIAHAIDLDAIETPNGWRLSGRKLLVENASSADWLLVSAHKSGDDTPSLFVVDPRSAGISRQDYVRPDYRVVSDIDFVCVDVPLSAFLCSSIDSLRAMRMAADLGVVAHLHEALGCMDALADLTFEYLKTRHQFGVALSTFQALQHRAAEMLIACEEARAILRAIGTFADDMLPVRRSISAAKVKVCQNAMFVGHQAIQLHGAIGMTDELPVGHYHKRILMICATNGTVEEHRQRFANDGDLLRQVAGESAE